MNRVSFIRTLLLAPFAAKAVLLSRAAARPTARELRNTPSFRQAYAKCADAMRGIISRVQPPIGAPADVCPMGEPSGKIYYMDLVSTPVVVPKNVRLLCPWTSEEAFKLDQLSPD